MHFLYDWKANLMAIKLACSEVLKMNNLQHNCFHFPTKSRLNSQQKALAVTITITSFLFFVSQNHSSVIHVRKNLFIQLWSLCCNIPCNSPLISTYKVENEYQNHGPAVGTSHQSWFRERNSPSASAHHSTPYGSTAFSSPNVKRVWLWKLFKELKKHTVSANQATNLRYYYSSNSQRG